MSSFQGVEREGSTVYRGVLISKRGFHCIQRCPHFEKRFHCIEASSFQWVVIERLDHMVVNGLEVLKM